MNDNSANNKRIAQNTVFLYTRMIFVLFVSLYTSRVVLNALGVEDFGLYNVIAGFVSMFSFFNATLSSSMQRFYNFEGINDAENGYYRVYCTGLIIHFILAGIILLLLETVGLWYVNTVMVVPEERLLAANIVYQTAVFSMLIVILQIPYLGIIMAAEKMDYYSVISIADVVLKLLAIIALPYLPFDKLIIYSIIILLISLFDLVCYAAYSKKRLLTKRFKWKIDTGVFKSLMSFIEKLSFNAFSEGTRLQHCIKLHKRLFGVDVKKIGGDHGYAGTENRDWCKANGIQTSFVKRGRPYSEGNKKEKDFVRQELARVRATAMEGSFGTQKEHYSLKRMMARRKITEIMYIFFGIHMANVVQLAVRIEERRLAASV